MLRIDGIGNDLNNIRILEFTLILAMAAAMPVVVIAAYLVCAVYLIFALVRFDSPPRAIKALIRECNTTKSVVVGRLAKTEDLEARSIPGFTLIKMPEPPPVKFLREKIHHEIGHANQADFFFLVLFVLATLFWIPVLFYSVAALFFNPLAPSILPLYTGWRQAQHMLNIVYGVLNLNLLLLFRAVLHRREHIADAIALAQLGKSYREFLLERKKHTQHRRPKNSWEAFKKWLFRPELILRLNFMDGPAFPYRYAALIMSAVLPLTASPFIGDRDYNKLVELGFDEPYFWTRGLLGLAAVGGIAYWLSDFVESVLNSQATFFSRLVRLVSISAMLLIAYFAVEHTITLILFPKSNLDYIWRGRFPYEVRVIFLYMTWLLGTALCFYQNRNFLSARMKRSHGTTGLVVLGIVICSQEYFLDASNPWSIVPTLIATAVGFIWFCSLIYALHVWRALLSLLGEAIQHVSDRVAWMIYKRINPSWWLSQ